MNQKDRPTLIELREKIGQVKSLSEQMEFLVTDTVPGGVPRGVLCEIIGSARTEWILRLFKQNPSLNIFWAENQLTILPTAIHQRGIDLNRILMAETGENLFQSLRKALKSRLFDCVVLPGAIEDIKMLKALQLFARESNSCIFFLSKIAKISWAIHFQLEAEWIMESESISINLLKSKFSQTGTV